MPDGSSGCASWCSLPAQVCPLDNVDYCKAASDYFPGATGFLVEMCGKSLLVSNRHVLDIGVPLFVRTRFKESGDPLRLSVGEVRAALDSNVDLAVASVRGPRFLRAGDLQIQAIPEDKLRAEGRTALAPLDSIHPGDEAVFAGFPVSLAGVRDLVKNRETPFVRSGVVSIVLPGKNEVRDATLQDVFLVDSWAFQGNSGSPVVLVPNFMTYQGEERSSRGEAKLVGVVSAFIDLNAPIEKAAVVRGVSAKVNSGLAVVQSIEPLEDTVKQFPDAKCEPIAAPAPPPAP
jgi:hypothetical protein